MGVLAREEMEGIGSHARCLCSVPTKHTASTRPAISLTSFDPPSLPPFPSTLPTWFVTSVGPPRPWV